MIPATFAAALAERYRLELELGRGGMATVYVAEDLRHGRRVALKVLRPELAATLGPERFQREIKLAAGLQHPHILTVHDSGEAAGQLWFTMPFVEGESLRDRLRREGQLPLPVVLQIAREVADALSYAHRHGVVHRDIKPENILLADGHALVADFGIAMPLHSGEAPLTETGFAVGTPPYMSPEQSVADRKLDGRSDLYSLACVVYEMLVGEPPYTGPSAQVIFAKRLRDPVPSARAFREGVPLALDAALQRALAKAPSDRYADTAEFSRALAATPNNSETPQKRTRIALAAMLVLGLTGVIVLARSRSARPATEANRAEALRESVRIAVLPFENIGDTSDAYFADGVADAVRGKLAELRGLEVIARGSSVGYAGSNTKPGEIARELGVRYLLTGTVRWAKSSGRASRVQVAPELMVMGGNGIPATEWSDRFDAAITDVFQVQGDIAGRVAQALGLRLGVTESRQLAAPPTKDIVAYDAYLRAEAFARLDKVSFTDNLSGDSAIVYYREAVFRDSGFALAWARMAGMQSVTFINSGRPAGGAKPIHELLTRVQRLAPDAPETAYLAAQVAYNVDADTAKAFGVIRDALGRFSGNAEIVEFAGVLENQVGRFDAALAYARRGLELDPKSTTLSFLAGFAALYARRYAEARPLIDQAERLQPENAMFVVMRAQSYLGDGKLGEARRVLAEGQRRFKNEDFIATVIGVIGEAWVLDSVQRQAVLRMPLTAFSGSAMLRALTFSDIAELEGDIAGGRRWADSTIRAAADDRKRFGANPGILAGMALAEARLGKYEEAVAHADQAVQASEADRVGFVDPAIRLVAARALVRSGHHSEAVKRIEEVLSRQYVVSAAWLAHDPWFVPLRGTPSFDSLVPKP